MSNIPQLQRELASKEAQLTEWKTEAAKLKADKERFEALQQKAKEHADKTSNSARYLQIIKDYQLVQEKLESKQSKILNLEAEITNLKERIAKETAFQSLLKEEAIKSETKTYSFSVKDYDPVSSNDLVGGGNLRIDFFQIDFKPTNQRFWVPRNVSFDGSYHMAFSVVLDSVQVDYLGDAKTKLEAKIYIKLKIGGIPSSNTTSFSINAEAGVETKATVKAVESGGGVKVGLNFGRSWTNNFNGGAAIITFDLKYDCLKGSPVTTKKTLNIPDYETINALVYSPSGEWHEGELDLMITDKKDKL